MPAATVRYLGPLGASGEDDTAGPETGTSLEGVQASVPPMIGSGSLVGRTVTLSAEVEDVVSNRSLTPGGDDTEELLVVHGPGLSVQEGQMVQVTGVVRAGYTVTEVEADLDIDFDDTFFGDPVYDPFELEPYLVTDAVTDAAAQPATPTDSPTGIPTDDPTAVPAENPTGAPTDLPEE